MIGGLGLFLYGLRTMSTGLQRIAGKRIRQLFNFLANNRLIGVFVGFSVTALIQSSSATTVMVVGFINSGIMQLSQAVGIIMGANIGTTITAWIIVVKVTRLSLPILGVGAAMFLFAKNRAVNRWGQVLLGFGMLFFGLKLMEMAFYPLRESPHFLPFFAQFGADDLWQVLKSVFAGFLLTLVIQSSSATIGITIALANQGLITYSGAAALVLGENIGTTVTMELAAIGANMNSVRAARVHSMFNIIGITYMVILLPWFVKIVDMVVPGAMDFISSDGTKPYIASHIAAGHSIFNITNTILLLPFSGFLVKIASWMVPDHKDGISKHLHFIDYGFISVPAIAEGQAKRELIRLAQLVLGMFKLLEKLLFHPVLDRKLSDKIFTDENMVDKVHAEISRFLASLLQNSPSREVTESARRYIHIVDEYESIADYCEMITKYSIKKENERIKFSDKATERLVDAHLCLLEYLEHCTRCFEEENEDLMIEAVAKNKSIQKLLKNLRKEHIDRLNRNECEVLAGLLYTDILAAFNNIRTRAFDIVEATAGLK
ncbi:Na/Pi cotransporter family protein [Thermodesulfobacteriota bacterium]